MTTACELVQIKYQGDGVQLVFPFPFPYDFKSEIEVDLWDNTSKSYVNLPTNDGTYPWEISNANPTSITFLSTPPPSPPTPGINEDPIYNVRITRTTDLTTIRAIFNQGSAIRAVDLNKNFEQLRYAIQEGRCRVSDEVFNYINQYFWNKYDETVYQGEAWVSSNAQLASTSALDDRFVDHVNAETIGGVKTFSDSPIVPTPTGGTEATNKTYVDTEINDKINDAITNDIGTDGTGITVTDDGDGTITLGLADDSIDFSKIKDVDIITESEQDAGSPSPTDTNLFTGAASSRRFDTIVSDSTPIGSDWEVGKTWLQPVPDNTLSIWNGTNWIGVASGGTFLTQPTVIYVDSVNGNDSFDGHRIINPKKTIKNAVASASAGDIVLVAPGVYQETLPIDITVSNLSIVGNSQRSCFIHPTVATEEETMFRCNSGTYIDGFTFVGLKASGTRGNHSIDDDSTYGLPENQGWVAGFYPNCVIRKSPYINNCTNFADSGIDNSNFDPNNYSGTGGDITSGMTGGGIIVDGSVPDVSSPLRSFVVNEFTQINLDGPGLLVCNNGYAQAVSFFGTFCHYHAKALSGGQINMEVGTTDFGRYGLIADGKSSSAIFSATADGAALTGDTSFLINAPTPAAGWFGTAERPSNTMLVEVGGNIYPVLSSSANGAGWSVVISNPDPSNRSNNLGLVNGHNSGDTVNFYLRSQISAAAHTFEYAGSGVDYTALPQNGGVVDENNQVIQTGAASIAGGQTEGAVFYSSTDENGKFKLGDTFQVDQKTGFVTIDPQSYSTNLVSDLSPQLGGDLDVQTFEINTSITNGDITIAPNGTGTVDVDTSRITNVVDPTGNQDAATKKYVDDNSIGNVVEDVTPQLGGDLDVQSYAITTSVVDGDIDLDADGSGLIKVTEYNLSQVPIVTQHDIGVGANEVPLNGMLGGMAYQDPASVSLESINGDVYFDSSGRLLVGTSTSVWDSLVEVARVGGSQFTSHRYGANAFPSEFNFLKSRGASIGTNTIVNDGDNIGQITFRGADGSSYIPSASIASEVDGTPGANDMPGRLVFSTTADSASSPAERMRIKSNGDVCISGTDPTNYSQTTGDGQIGWNRSESSLAISHNNSSTFAPIYVNKFNYTNGVTNNRFISWYVNGIPVAAITTNGSSVAYNTSSDYRLKENVVPLTGAADRVNQLQVHRFNFIADPDTTVDGFIAHEAQAVVPECVTGTKDEVDADGNPVYQGIDQSKLVPLLTAALQEALAKIETQGTAIAALEARLTALEGGTN